MGHSDKSRTVEDLKQRIADFCQERNWDEPHNPKDLAIGAVTEASELLEIFRFFSEEESFEMLKEPSQRLRIGEELADTLTFVLRFSQLYGFDISQCLEDKLAKNAIKYPAQSEVSP